MQLTSRTFKDGDRIPGDCAFAIPDELEHMLHGRNHNPHLQWSSVPAGARSLVLMCVDTDVPADTANANQEGQTLAASMPRVEFIHWVMVDIPAADGEIEQGACSNGIVAGGKPNPPGPTGSRQGLNDYTGFMAGDPDMRGDYVGYDGPCPPWNDERLHHYHFILYATDLDRCPVPARFTAAEVRRAIDGHVLAEARITGTYSLNPSVR